MRQPQPNPVSPWIERVPPIVLVSIAGASLVVCTVAFALAAAQSEGWTAWALPVIAAAALTAVMLVPVRLSAIVSVGALAAIAALATIGGSDAGATFGVGLFLAAALVSAAYVRMGLRRREAELEVARDVIRELTRRDRITELLSGRRELTWLDAELARSRRHHHTFALVLVRPDRLDVHAGADGTARLEVLEAVAEVVGHELRATDVALRYDAETFALILPETEAEGARVAAERIRLLLPQRVNPGAALTVSSGIATFPRDASGNDDLTAIAAQALERAVELGGNRTLCASGEGVPAGWTLRGANAEA